MIQYSEDLVRRILLDDPSVAPALNLWHYTKIADAGTSALSDALGTNTVISELKLDGQGLTAEGALSLANALMINGTLRSLHLADNALGDAGATSIANALRYNSSLDHLFLDGCGIRDAGATALAAALGGTDGGRPNYRLQGLYLGSNEISNHGARRIAEALRTNRSLVAFRAPNNDITTEVENQIEELVERNRILKAHGKSYKKMGRSFYLRKGADGTSWRWADPQLIGDAAVGDGLALEIVHRTLHKVLERDGSQRKGLRDLASRRLLYHGWDGRSNLLQMAWAKTSEGARGLCKFLEDDLGVRGRAVVPDDEGGPDVDPVDDDGGSACDLMCSGKHLSPTEHRRRVAPSPRAVAGNFPCWQPLRGKENGVSFVGSLAGLHRLPQMKVHPLQEQHPLKERCGAAQHITQQNGGRPNNMRAYFKDVHVLRDVFENRKPELVECLIVPSDYPQHLRSGSPVFEIGDITHKPYAGNIRTGLQMRRSLLPSERASERDNGLSQKAGDWHRDEGFDYLKLPEI